MIFFGAKRQRNDFLSARLRCLHARLAADALGLVTNRQEQCGFCTHFVGASLWKRRIYNPVWKRKRHGGSELVFLGFKINLIFSKNVE